MNHQLIDQRSLKMAAIIARRLEENPELLRVAQTNLERWLRICSPQNVQVLTEWQEILNAGLPKVTAVLRGQDENSTKLRQSSPFAGEEFITRKERTEILTRTHSIEL